MDKVVPIDDDKLELGERTDALETTRRNAAHNPPTIANPSPLGLFGFFIVTWLSGVLKILGKSGETEYLPTAGMFIGGFAQLIAGVIHYAKNNTHSATTFALYGLHWIGIGTRMLSRAATPPSADVSGVDVGGVIYYSLFTIATVVIWLPTLLMNIVLAVTLFLVVILFLMDAIYEATRSRTVEIIAGIFSCLAATGALHLVTADFLNEAWGKVVVPIFPHEAHKEDYYARHGRKYFPTLHFHKSVTASAHH